MYRSAADVLRHLDSRISRLESQIRTASVDKKLLEEVSNFIQSENRIYANMIKPLLVQQAKLMRAGRWSRDNAVKVFMPIVDEGVNLYRQEYSLPALDKDNKTTISNYLIDNYLDTIEDMASL